jgi:hypothetical protein
MDHSHIARFLAADPEISDDAGGTTHIYYTYTGALLKYEILITPSAKQVAISADPVTPFSGQSIFEFYINADWVSTLDDTYNRKNPICLGFWIGDGNEWDDCRMTLHMRDDGDLIVWPRAFHFDRPQEQPAEQDITPDR